MHRSRLIIVLVAASIMSTPGCDSSESGSGSEGSDTSEGSVTPEPDASDGSNTASDASGDTLGDTGPAVVPVDILFVLDPSTSMCTELVDTVGGFEGFMAGVGEVDPRVAVVTVAMACDPEQVAEAGITTAVGGRFNDRAVAGFPPSCSRSVPRACVTDSDCDGLSCELYGVCDGPQDTWRCSGTQMASCVASPNGGLNTSCVPRCTADTDCEALLGDTWHCMKPSGNESDWQCAPKPPTEACPVGDGGVPAAVAPVLDGSNLELFPCIGTVGALQLKCFSREQGLDAARVALDVEGPNAAQLACSTEQEAAGECVRFLRDGAWLVIVFVSDEDDCSADSEIELEDGTTCSHPDSDAELTPVSEFASALEAAAGDPGRVIIGTVTGDVIVPDDPGAYPQYPAGFDIFEGWVADDTEEPPPCELVASPTDAEVADFEACMRDWYLASFGSPYVCYQKTPICDGVGGNAQWGRRYQELAAHFGERGLVENICDPSGVPAALANLGASVGELVAAP